ncbi:MAG: hypothetical protein Q8P62_03065 [Candidatus Peregrinibacteria bacterium]|nr:hypothetical protein [Candidatus Peregrinibacteria bacterium]
MSLEANPTPEMDPALVERFKHDSYLFESIQSGYNFQYQQLKNIEPRYHQMIADYLIAKGFGMQVLHHINEFQDIDSEAIIGQFVEHYEELKKILTPEMLESIRRNGGISFPSHKLAEVAPEHHQLIADQLIALGQGSYVLRYIAYFHGVDPNKVIDALINRGEIWMVSPVVGTVQKDVARKVRAATPVNYVKQLSRRERPRPPAQTEALKDRILRKLKGPKPPEETSTEDIVKMLANDGFPESRTGSDKRLIQFIQKTFGQKINWPSFLSSELYEEGSALHHYEMYQISCMYERLKEYYSEEEIMVIMQECPITNIVDFAEAFEEKGRQKIISALTEQQAQLFEVSPESTVWRYGNLSTLSMQEYLEQCGDRTQSSGRLLVHVTKDHLFEKLVKNPKLTSSALLHVKDDSEEASKLLDDKRNAYTWDESPVNTHGISVGTHFSFDNKIAYPKGKFACVFAAEALFNNYAYLETNEYSENDIVIGGMSNDYIDDPTHQIDIQKYGFFLAPKAYEGRIQDIPEGTRIFYYTGKLGDGLNQLREQIGEQEKKVKLARKIKFNRRIGVEHQIDINNSFYAQVYIQHQLEAAGEDAKKGNNIFPSVDFLLTHMGKGGGKGNYFSV